MLTAALFITTKNGNNRNVQQLKTLDKEVIVYLPNGILLSHTKEPCVLTGTNLLNLRH